MILGAAITGMGAVTGHGAGCSLLWSAIESGSSCIRPVERFPTEDFRVHVGAQVDDDLLTEVRTTSGPALALRMALTAAREAWGQAGIGDRRVDPGRIALILGSGLGDEGDGLHSLTELVAKGLGITGPLLTVSTACCSSTNALGIGRDLLAEDAADLVVAGGVDVLTPEVFSGFHALGVLNPRPCSPFSTSLGTTLGEGAGFMVLERPDEAATAGRPVRAYLDGYGLSGDAFHETSPDPNGGGVARAMNGALTDAGLGPDAVGYVNAHGSGTIANDPAEWRGICQALGSRATCIPVSSLKGTIGHAQGAAGALEAIATVMALERQVVAPTLNFQAPRPQGPEDPVGQIEPRPHKYEVAVSNNSAFGGCNAAVVIASRPSEERERGRAEVHLAGWGTVGPLGPELGVRAEGGVDLAGRVPDFSLQDYLPAADPRGMDPSSRFLTAAACLALSDAGITLKGPMKSRAGLIVGMVRPSSESMRAFGDSIRKRGLARLDAKAFARIVLNATGGECSKLLGLKGPNFTVTTGAGSGLAAVVRAAALVAGRDDADFVVAGGVDEWDRSETGTLQGEGAATVVLAKGNELAEEKKGILIEGFALGPAGRAKKAATAAMVGAGLDWVDLDEIYTMGLGPDPAGRLGLDSSVPIHDLTAACSASPSAGSVWMLLVAARNRRRGKTGRALVLSQEGCSVSSALIVRNRRP